MTVSWTWRCFPGSGPLEATAHAAERAPPATEEGLRDWVRRGQNATPQPRPTQAQPPPETSSFRLREARLSLAVTARRSTLAVDRAAVRADPPAGQSPAAGGRRHRRRGLAPGGRSRPRGRRR